MRSVDPSPWLVFPPAVDLANTVVPGVVDLLTTSEQLARFITAERGRVPGVEGAAGRLAEVRRVREPVRALLTAATAGEPLPEGDVEQVNAWSAASPTYPVLLDGVVHHRDAARNPFHAFRAAVARSAIELAGGHQEAGLLTCPAPGCGMFYLRAHPRQQWCSPACGNRARVARHSARGRWAPSPG